MTLPSATLGGVGTTTINPTDAHLSQNNPLQDGITMATASFPHLLQLPRPHPWLRMGDELRHPGAALISLGRTVVADLRQTDF